MNRQILRLSGVAMVLLASLIAGTTYWQSWARADLAEKQDNAIQRVAQFSIRRGAIESGGRLLAGNRRSVADGRPLYFRRYPLGRLTAHVVGYSTAARARTGLEKSLNDYLTASNESLSTFVDQSLDQLRGKPIRGNDVRLTLNLRAQQVALDALGTQCGAVAALDPRNGAVKVLASAPSYDPNLVENHYSAIGRIKADCKPAAPLDQPRHSRSLSARLDVQGRHRVGGARVEEVHAGLDVPRSRLLRGVRETGAQLRRPERTRGLRHDPSVRRARALGQLGLLQHRQGAGCDSDPPSGGAVRLLLRAAARDADRRAPCRAGSQPQRQRLLPARDSRRRPGPPRLRTGASARDAAADGDGRGCDRKRRQRDAAVRRLADRLSRWQDDRRGRSRPASGVRSRATPRPRSRR